MYGISHVEKQDAIALEELACLRELCRIAMFGEMPARRARLSDNA